MALAVLVLKKSFHNKLQLQNGLDGFLISITILVVMKPKLSIHFPDFNGNDYES